MEPGFGLENLPYGVIGGRSGGPRVAVRFGEHALDLAALHEAGGLGVDGRAVDGLDPAVLRAPTLNALIALGPQVWAGLRAAVRDVLERGAAGTALVPLADAGAPFVPIAPRTFIDGYCSREHATHVGEIFRPGGEALAANWLHMPIAYHGRASTVVVSGTGVRRPVGQLGPGVGGGGGDADFGPEPKLDFELELGYVTGNVPAGTSAAEARRALFGVVLLNDWSARAIQRWEYQPLGPFNGKSFASSISPWVVPFAALEPYLVAGPEQDPAPLPYLRAGASLALEIELEALVGGERVTAVNARGLYWNFAQQLAQATFGGAPLAAGDLVGSGTVSGSAPGSLGCLLEQTRDGTQPRAGGVGGGYLRDGEEVILRGATADGRVSLGEVRGVVLPASSGSGH